MAIHHTIDAQAVDTYKGDGTAGGTQPDLMQDWGQKQKGICAAAASADAIWYLDQHGWGKTMTSKGLVDHVDPAMPNATWRDKDGGMRNGDGRDLVLAVGNRIYGPDHMANKTGRRRGSGVQGGISNYILSRKEHVVNKPPGVLGLVVTGKNGYSKWKATLQAGHEAVGVFSWRKANGTPFFAGSSLGDHAMTGAGVDSNDNRILVVHGWGDHPANQPPYKKPPYGQNETPYIVEYAITINNDRVTIPNNAANAELFGGRPADHISMDRFIEIKPGKRGGIKGAVGPGTQPGFLEYSYEIENDSFAPIHQFVIDVKVPFLGFPSLNVKTPPGWLAQPWDPDATPDMLGWPPEMTEPGVPDAEAADSYEWTIGGIIFYKDPDPGSSGGPVLSGETLPGFSFEVPDGYRSTKYASYTGFSDRLTVFLDPASENIETEWTFTLGPELPTTDSDGDGLPDIVETETGVFVSPSDTGSEIFETDTDGDAFDDGLEVAAGSDPNDPGSIPMGPAFGVPAMGGAARAVLAMGLAVLIVRRGVRSGRLQGGNR